MKNEEKIKNTCVTLGLLVSFMLWTIAFRCLYVQAIRVNGSSVGFATLNGFVHRFKGVYTAIYTIKLILNKVSLFSLCLQISSINTTFLKKFK